MDETNGASRMRVRLTASVGLGALLVATGMALATRYVPDAAGGGLWSVLAAACAGVVALVALVYWVLGWMLRPISDLQAAIDALARGEIDTRVEPEQLGPLANVGRAANRLGETYTQMGVQVVAMTERLRHLVARIAEIAAGAEAGTQAQAEGVDRATTLMGQIEESIGSITRDVEGLSRSTEEASSSVLEMGSSIDEVARSMDSLHHVVESASTSSQEMGVSIRQVAESAASVQRMAEDTASSMSQTDRAIQQVSEHVREASELTEQVSGAAEEGSRAVATTIDGISDIRTLTLDTKHVLERLAERIHQIGEIVDVISSINDETNLLSLNAAIIAAQAGEQGKAFAVVANHVKTLAERTSGSTQQIARLIHSVQQESNNATQAMEAGIDSVETGVQRSRRAGEVLETIRRSASEASTRVSEISRAASEQERNSKHVAEAAKGTSHMVHQISSAMAEQSRASEQMLRTSESSLEVCRRVHRSTDEQRETGQFITESITAISEMMRSIQESLVEHSRISSSVAETVEGILETGRKSGAQVSDLVETVSELEEDAEALSALLGRFRSGGASLSPTRSRSA